VHVAEEPIGDATEPRSSMRLHLAAEKATGWTKQTSYQRQTIDPSNL